MELKNEAGKRTDVIRVRRLSRLHRLSALTSLMHIGELKPWKGLPPTSPRNSERSRNPRIKEKA
jgi:hypothetical protein